MVASSTIQTFRLAVVGLGGKPAGGEESLIELVRRRLNAALVKGVNWAVRRQFVHGLTPLVSYLKSSLAENDFNKLQFDGLDDAIFELYKVIAARTRLVKRYSSIVDSDEEWTEVARGLRSVARGETPAPPSAIFVDKRSAREQWTPPAQGWFCWRSRRWTVTLWAIFGVFFIYLIDALATWELITTGRMRIGASAFGGFLIFMGAVWWSYGPEVWSVPECFRGTPEPLDDTSEGASDGDTAPSDEDGLSPSLPDRGEGTGLTRPDESALESLRRENERLRDALGSTPTRDSAGLPLEQPEQLRSPNVDALRAFALDQKGEGPISQTADRFGTAVPVGIPQLPASAGQPSSSTWQPFRAAAEAQSQATQLSALLAMAEREKAVNPYGWASAFWQRVAALETQSPLSPDLLRLLQSQGYVGGATISPPRDDLRAQLEQIRIAGVPAHGTGASAFMDAGPLPAASNPDRWSSQLAPDLKRAAPEIYRSFRSAGSSSVRDWLNSQYGQNNRSSPQWVELWNIATNADFELRGLDERQTLERLASSDALEIGLRRIAAWVYEQRTHDKAGAAHMLAVTAPGTFSDVAPTWMIEEATAHSKMEHQRAERVHKAAPARGSGTFESSYPRGGSKGGGRTSGGKGGGRTSKGGGAKGGGPRTHG